MNTKNIFDGTIWCMHRYFLWLFAVIFPKLKTILIHYWFTVIFISVATFFYIEVGHNSGWKRAAEWYTCIHTHHHFPWQK